MSEILTRKYSVFSVQPHIIRNEGEQIVARHNTELECVFGRTPRLNDSVRLICPDAVIDSGRRQNWEVQHSVTRDSMYNNLTTGA